MSLVRVPELRLLRRGFGSRGGDVVVVVVGFLHLWPLVSVRVGALRGDVTLDAAPDALALRRAVLREVVGALADLARAAVDVDALAVLRAISDEVSGLAADEAVGEFVVGPRLLAVARGVLLASAVVADLVAPRAALRAALLHAAVAEGVSHAPAPEADELRLPDAAVSGASRETGAAARSFAVALTLLLQRVAVLALLPVFLLCGIFELLAHGAREAVRGLPRRAQECRPPRKAVSEKFVRESFQPWAVTGAGESRAS